MRATGGTARAIVQIGGIGSLRGAHNAQNAACGTAAALALSLSAEQKPLVQQWLRNYRKLKDTLERICELNLELLRPEKNR